MTNGSKNGRRRMKNYLEQREGRRTDSELAKRNETSIERMWCDASADLNTSKAWKTTTQWLVWFGF
jgi:hypothetical protein